MLTNTPHDRTKYG